MKKRIYSSSKDGVIEFAKHVRAYCYAAMSNETLSVPTRKMIGNLGQCAAEVLATIYIQDVDESLGLVNIPVESKE